MLFHVKCDCTTRVSELATCRPAGAAAVEVKKSCKGVKKPPLCLPHAYTLAQRGLL